MTFRAPLKDLAFSLSAVTGIERLYQSPAFPDFDADILDAVLEAAGDLASDILAPLNRVGDAEGAQLENGQVIVASGFKDAVAAFADGGWSGLGADPAHGGQGLPKALEMAAYEMFHAANMAFALYPTLSQGAIEALNHHGTDRQKALYLPKLVAGEWSGTMNLTEPQAGSDLALLTTQAVPDGDGYRITGQKIFITWGDHETRDNILHLVLARLPDAPAGTRGISLFLCPKYLVGEDGTLGARNSAHCVGLEHKLGIHASPTCVMAFEGAYAELVGAPHQGLMAMFTMMNAARLAVGIQGVGIAERAYQQALAYALERKQGKSILTGEAKAPIFNHPDVRLMLGLSKAKIEAARGICLLTAIAADEQRLGEDDGRLKRREDFLVPIAKAWSTDIGVEVASSGVQVHGGMGFIEETGAAQHYRDARIAPIYEGTNGIQAGDLVGRKLGDDGTAAFELIRDIESFIKNNRFPEGFYTSLRALAAGLSAFEDATQWLIKQKPTAPGDVAAGATAYLKLAGDVIGGYVLLKGAMAAQTRIDAGDGDAAWLKGRIGLWQLYAAHVLPHADAHLTSIRSGVAVLDGLTPEAL
ncbi:acyl-CoA dehydrogenase [Asticcacaulis sp. BYS171W]|uniref:Acyl-CoA dehydrogenase n=1 Tax=Asticcacaulis aquaticus TaxID=2984212 RepID=A0ABT5HNK1_9CAUL|nr:acyl-CoA dehydrogenase [Asticcacaulis aquaticus]MDC7681649.1 acyl-CoA dehydrogenase [Asticcacaulis aquaticus]